MRTDCGLIVELMNPAPDIDDQAVPEPAKVPEAPAPERKHGLWARFKDYLWDWRAVLAVVVATFIVGGLAGLAVGMGTGDRHEHRGPQFRHGPGFRGGPDGVIRPGQGGFGPQGQMPGQGYGPGRQGGQVPNAPTPSGGATPNVG